MAFIKAVKTECKARVAIAGPAGSGKTMSALRIARGLVGPEGKIAMLDSEHGSASKYSDVTEFDTDPDFLAPFHPEKYMKGIDEAVAAGYQAIILDSLSHAWAGQGGLLEVMDNHTTSKGTRSGFSGWKYGTPIQQRMVEKILSAPIHVIATMRTKTEWIVDQVSGGKSSPRKVGTAPVQRDGIEYEFDIVAEIDVDHRASITKTRCPQLTDQVFDRPGEDLGRAIAGWVQGAPAPAPKASPPSPPPATKPVDAPDEAPAEAENPAPDPTPEARKGGKKTPPADKPATEAQLARLREYAEDPRLFEVRKYIVEFLGSDRVNMNRAGAWLGRLKKKLAEVEGKEAA